MYKWLLLLCVLFPGLVAAQQPAKVSIIIDDLGNNLNRGRSLIDLPYQLTYSFLPNRPYTVELANRAAQAGKEVMVHLPMQSTAAVDLGKNGLTLELTDSQFKDQVRKSIAAVPHAKGVNNHMGSLLTRHPGHMAWLMDVLNESSRKFYFVDSRTTSMTVAIKVAREHYVPHIGRDIFIDHYPDRNEVVASMNELMALANKNGYAVAIGHPYLTTIEVLAEYLPVFAKHGIQVVPVTEILQDRGYPQWAQVSGVNN